MGVQLSEKESNLLALAWQCFEEPPKVNTKKLAEMGGYKNANSANACWFTLKKKLLPLNGVNAVRLSEKDVKLLVTVGQCFDNVAKVDTKKLAKLGNYKNSNSANACWFALKKKLQLLPNTEAGEAHAGTKKRSAPAGEDESDENWEHQTTTTTTPPKKKKTRKSKAPMNETDGDGKVKPEGDKDEPAVTGKAATSSLKRDGRSPKVASKEEEEGEGIIDTMTKKVQSNSEIVNNAVPKKKKPATNTTLKAGPIEDGDEEDGDDHIVAGRRLASAIEYTTDAEDDVDGHLG